MVATTWFERVVLLIIVANCVVFTLDGSSTDQLDLLFTLLFLIEAILKIIALGFVQEGGYFKDPWNTFDFTIVLASVLSVISKYFVKEIAVVTIVRTIRLLRPLRAISGVPEMRIIANSVFHSIPKLFHVVCLYFFFISASCIAALQLWKGSLRRYCYDPLGNTSNPPQLCSAGMEGFQCPWGWSCDVGSVQNPNYGFTSFDNAGAGLLTLFICISMEGWTQIMYWYMDAAGPSAAIYFIVVLMFGAFFIVNLTLVIITSAYDQNVRLEKEKVLRLRAMQRKFLGLIASEVQPFAVAVRAGPEQSNLLNKRYVKWQRRLRTVVQSRWYTAAVTIMVLLNTVILSMEHYGMGPHLEKIIEIVNMVCTIFFIVEVTLKFIALGAKKFKQDKFNIFDLVVIVFSIIDLSFSVNLGLSVFRTFRLFRVIKLMRQVDSLKRWLEIILESAQASCFLSILLAIVIFVYSLVGLQLFRGSFCGKDAEPCTDTLWEREHCHCRPRSHFDNVFQSFLTVFQIITSENWTTPMFNAMRVHPANVIFFLTLFVIGNYLVLNLFVALLLSASSRSSDRARQSRSIILTNYTPIKRLIQRLRGTMRKFTLASIRRIRSQKSDGPRQVLGTTENIDVGVMPVLMMRDRDQPEQTGLGRGSLALSLENPLKNPLDIHGIHDDSRSGITFASEELSQNEGEEESSSEEDTQEKVLHLGDGYAFRRQTTVLAYDSQPDATGEESSLFVFSASNKFRSLLVQVVEDTKFELFVLILIVISTCTLAADTKLRAPNQRTSVIIANLNIALTTLFTIEAAMKIISYGFLLHKGAYLRDSWNKLDFAIVLISLISLMVGPSSNLQLFKTLRTLRPLRIVAKVEGLRIVLFSLFQAVPTLVNIVVLSFLFWLIFAISGVQFFKGAFYSCTDITLTTKESCLINGNRWVNAPAHFDNTGSALLTLLQILTLEGWVDIMNNGMDITGVDTAGVKNNRPYMAVYFVVFVVVGQFFMLNLFVGVLIDQFFEMKEKHEAGGALLTEEQKEWVNIQKILMKNTECLFLRLKSGSKVKGLWKLLDSERFEAMMLMFIGLNALVMSLDHYGQSTRFSLAIDVTNSILIAIFVAEFIAKVLVFGARNMLSTHWNRLDTFATAVSFVGAIFNLLQYSIPSLSVAADVLKLISLIRLFKMVRYFRGVQLLIHTFILSIPSFSNVASLMGLTFIMYAVWGVEFFVLIEGNNTPGGIDGRYASFRTFGGTMLLLLRMSTGESWNSLMNDCRVQPPNCSPQRGNCGSPTGAPFYFYSFMQTMIVMLNLFIAVIMSQFSDVTTREEENPVQDFHMLKYWELWKKHDKDLALHFPVEELIPFLKNVTKAKLPLSVMPGNGKSLFSAVAKLDLKLEADGSLYYKQVLLAVAKYCYGRPLPHRVEEELEKQWVRVRTDRAKMKSEFRLEVAVAPIEFTFEEYVAALRMQTIWKGYMARKRAECLSKEKLMIAQQRKVSHDLRSSYDGSPRQDTLQVNNPGRRRSLLSGISEDLRFFRRKTSKEVGAERLSADDVEYSRGSSHRLTANSPCHSDRELGRCIPTSAGDFLFPIPSLRATPEVLVDPLQQGENSNPTLSLSASALP